MPAAVTAPNTHLIGFLPSPVSLVYPTAGVPGITSQVSGLYSHPCLNH